MKKYVKPELFYERYELSEHIADCAWEWDTSTNPENCFALPDDKLLEFSYGDYVYMLFTDFVRCTITPDVLEDFCYQSGGPSANLWKS